jgi:hypothetical protein
VGDRAVGGVHGARHRLVPESGARRARRDAAARAALAASPFWNVHRSRRQITFAFDDIRTERLYRRGVEIVFAAGMKAWQLQSFVLVGLNSTIEQDLQRIDIIRSYGIDPFVMVYRDDDSGQSHRDPTTAESRAVGEPPTLQGLQLRRLRAESEKGIRPPPTRKSRS